MMTYEQFCKIFRYDPETGLFHCLGASRRNVRRVGDVAGKPRKKGYPQIWIGNQPHLAHRLAFLYMTGEWPTGHVDHKDGNPQNNKWDNLRICPEQTLNNANMKLGVRNRSGFKGVSFCTTTGKWAAGIMVHKRSYYLGRYDTKEQASEAYMRAADKHFGEFARAA